MLSDWDATYSVSSYYGGASSDITVEFDDGESFNFEIGKKNGNRSFGLLVGHASNDISKISDSGGSIFPSTELTSMPVLGVLGFSTQITENLSLNLGAGAGVNFLTLEGYGQEEDDLTLQFQAKAGLELLLTEKVSLGLDYRFSVSTSPEYDGEVYSYYTGTVSDSLEGDALLGHFIGLSVNISF